MIVFSSHGGGFEGFGTDDHPGRLLYQTNSDIVGALRSALDSNLGEGSKFDVIGFDACLMQSFDAADDYSSVGQYYLASEQVEPGHGMSILVDVHNLSFLCLTNISLFHLQQRLVVSRCSRNVYHSRHC
jgi:hypothetical protein